MLWPLHGPAVRPFVRIHKQRLWHDPRLRMVLDLLAHRSEVLSGAPAAMLRYPESEYLRCPQNPY